MKLLTHLYIANLIIKEIESTGKLRIAPVQGNYVSGTLREPCPYGNDAIHGNESNGIKTPKTVFPFKGRTFTVTPDIKRVITQYKEYFRGGAAGCDTIPDIIFSQMVIHPKDSGIWIEYMYDKMLMLPQKERDPVYAFILGWMTHYAADMFGHAYVNEYAKGWFETPKDSVSHRHMAVEGYMDGLLSDSGFLPKVERKVKIPAEFLATCFSDVGSIEDKIRGIEGRIYTVSRGDGNIYKHVKTKKGADEIMECYEKSFMIIRHLSVIRDLLRSVTQYPPKDEADWKLVLHTSIERTGYLSGWADDFDNAILGWVKAWETALQGLLNGDGMLSIRKPLIEWYEKHWMSLIGVPKWLEEFKRAIDAVKKAIDDFINTPLIDLTALKEFAMLKALTVGADAFEKLYPDQYKWIESMYAKAKESDRSMETVKEKTTGTAAAAGGELLKGPKAAYIVSIFNGEFKDIDDFHKHLENDFKMFAKIPYEDIRQGPYGDPAKEYLAFSYCLSAAKLCVAGYKNLNDYLNASVYSGHSTVTSVRRLTVRIKTKSGMFAGTDDVVRFDIVSKDRKMDTRTVIGSYFSSGDTDVKTVILPRPVPYTNIDYFTLSKRSLTFDDNWEIESAEVIDKDTGVLLGFTMGSTVLKNDNVAMIYPKNIPARPKETTIEVPHKIMSWFYSLDGVDFSEEGYRPSKPWEFMEYAIFRDAVSSPPASTSKSGDLFRLYDDAFTGSFDVSKTPAGSMMDVGFAPSQGKAAPGKEDMTAGTSGGDMSVDQQGSKDMPLDK
ncbi:MAG: zinc dependent phospholipase C family protein [Methanomassiliicoccaceae archaeon]|nr:zinc dependent phospholipase C family protein [Methanomassiliicoccaceae archaeon]